MEEEEDVNKSVGGGEEGEWRITATTGGGGEHHHAHIVTVMSAEDLEGERTFVPVTFDTGGRGGGGEVRVFQVPISMLQQHNFHFVDSTQAQQEVTSSQEILGSGGSQDGQLAVTLVTTSANEETDREMRSEDVVEEHSEEFVTENIPPVSLAPPPPPQQQPSLPSLRSRRTRPIRKNVDTPGVSLRKEEEKSVTSGEEGGLGKSVGPKWPEDKCANCATLFNDCESSGDNQSLHEKLSHLKPAGLESEEEEEVSNLEALQYAFSIRIKTGKGKDDSTSSSDICWLCKSCSSVLREVYEACRAFTKLTKEEAFLYKRLRSKVIQSKKVKSVPADSSAETPEALGSKVEVKMEVVEDVGEDEAEEEDEWITGDLSDDEDFRASPTDLEKAEVSSESSESETTDPYHNYSNKRKSKSSDMTASPKKKKGRKNKTGDSFWWDINMKTDSDDDETSLGFYKRRKKLRVKKSLLAGITYDCSACEAAGGASFPSPRELKIHLRECHREVGVVTDMDVTEGSTMNEGKASATSCRLCSFQVFPSVGEFKDHWTKEHEEANISSSEVLPYECFTCKKTFVEWAALVKHRVTHNLQRPYKCRLCGQSWRRADELQVHWSRTHAKEFLNDTSSNAAGSDGSMSKKEESLPPAKRREAVPCSVCGKAFIRHDHLKLHMRIHTGEKPFPCPTCGKAFSDPRGLAYHEVTHSSERPYCCTVCGMTFKRLHHLNDHERNHASDVARPFTCEVCGKAFKYKKHLNSHSVIHGASKDHSCEICHKAFNRKDNLRQHVKKVHGKEPGPETMSSGGGGGGLRHHSLVPSLEGGGEDEDVLVGDEPEVSIEEEGIVRSEDVEVPTATTIPIVTGSGESLTMDHIVYMTL